MENQLLFRPIIREDLDIVFSLLDQLTEINHNTRNKDKCWKNFIDNTSSNSIVGLYNGKIIAYGSIVIENKIRGEYAGHIEDIVVDHSVRGKNIGVKLVNELIKIGEQQNCYRITLTCSESLIKFYEKTGFKVNNISMKRYKS